MLNQFRSILFNFILIAFLTTQLTNGVSFAETNLETQNSTNQTSAVFNNEVVPEIHWALADWDAPANLYEDERDFMEKMAALESQGNFEELKTIQKFQRKMSDDFAMEKYNVPQEIRELVRAYRQGELSKQDLKIKISMITGEKIEVEKIEDMKVLDLNDLQLIKPNKLQFIKEPEIKNSIMNFEVKNKTLQDIKDENAKKAIEKNGLIDLIKDLILPRASADTLEIPLIQYYEGIEKEPVDNTLFYLSNIQNEDGSFGTEQKFINTCKTVSLLMDFGLTDNDQYSNALNYLLNQTPKNNREKACLIKAKFLKNLDYQNLLNEVLNSMQSNLGIPYNAEYDSDILTGIEVLDILTLIGNDNMVGPLFYLLQKINSDGSVYYEKGNSPSYHLINETLKVLQPFDGYTLDAGNGNIINISAKIDLMLNYLASVYDENTNILNNEQSLIDFAYTARSFNFYEHSPEKLEIIRSYLKDNQSVNGNFGLNISTNLAAMEALARSNLIITNVQSDGSLVNKSTAEFKITIKNKGYLKTAKVDFYTFVDNFKFFESKNINQNGFLLRPFQEGILTLQITETQGIKGLTNFKFYFENTNDSNHDNNWSDNNFTFANAPDNSPAVQLYYLAYQYVINGKPAIGFRYNNKEDTERFQQIMGFREKGAVEWKYVGLGNEDDPGYYISSIFKDNTWYEFISGVQASNENLYMRADITEVLTSSTEYGNSGQAKGVLTMDYETLPNMTTSGIGVGSVSNENGELIYDKVYNGAVAERLVDDIYETLLTKIAIKPNVLTENVRVFTHLKEDSENPVLNSVEIKNHQNYVIKNQNYSEIFAIGADNIKLKEGDFYVYNPSESYWDFIGTYSADSNSYVAFDWYIPETYLGQGYKIKAILRDYRDNISESKEWGPFEIIDGTLPTGSIQINGLENNQWIIGREKEISWSITAKNNLASIASLELRYGSTYTVIAEDLDITTTSYRYKMPFEASLVGDQAYFIITAVDQNNNSGEILSNVFEIIDNTSPPIAPWQDRNPTGIKITDNGKIIRVHKIFDNNDSSKEFIYQEKYGLPTDPEGKHIRLIYRKQNSDGTWNNPVIIKEFVYNLSGQIEHEFYQLEAVKSSEGKIHMVYKDNLSGNTENNDQSQIYYAEVLNGNIIGVEEISFDNTDSNFPKIVFDGSKIHITWTEGWSLTTRSGTRYLKYRGGTGFGNWNVEKTITPDHVGLETNSMAIANNIPFAGYVHSNQLFIINKPDENWSSPIVAPKKDILKSKINKYSGDAAKFYLIVKQDPNNQTNYLWLDNINTPEDLEQVLTANNFIYKNEILNEMKNNEYFYNSRDFNIIHLGNNQFAQLFLRASEKTAWKNNLYKIVFTYNTSSAYLKSVEEKLVQLKEGNAQLEDYSVANNNSAQFDVIYIESLEAEENTSKVYHSAYDQNGIYYKARISPLTVYVGNYNIILTKVGDRLTAFYDYHLEGEDTLMYNTADFSKIKNYRVNAVTPAQNASVETSTLKLEWKTSGGTFTNYNFIFNSNPDDPDTGILTNNLSYNINNLIPGQTYYWQVAANDTAGNKIYSYPWSFKTTSDFLQPDIFITSETEIINNGNYNIGVVKTLGEKEVEFTIINKGGDVLKLTTSPILKLQGVNSDEFTITKQPLKNILAINESDNFKIKFSPKSAGVKNAQISIQNNDQDENPYVINVSGMGGSQMLEYKFNEGLGSSSFADTSGNNITATCSGNNCPQAEAVGKIDKALLFDGSSDYLNVPDSSLISPREQITIETMVNLQLNTNFASNVIVSKNFDYEITLQNNRNLRMGITNEAGVRVVAVFPVAMEYDKWNHIVMTYDGSKIRGYVNGKLIGEQAQTGLIRWSKTKATIGSIGNGFYIKGRMDQFNLFNYQWNEAEIKAKYQKLTNILQYKFNDPSGATSFADESGNEINADCSGLNCPGAQSEGKIDKAILFDGVDDRMTVADSILVSPKEELTIEALVNLDKTSTYASQVLLTKNGDYEMTIVNNGALRLGITNETGSRVVWNIGSAVTFGKWNYVVMTYDGQKIRGYVNGRLVGEQAQSGYIKRSVGKEISIGSLGNGFWLKGKVDSLNLYNYKWSEEEIAVKYKEIFNDPNIALYEFNDNMGAKSFVDSWYNGLNLSCTNCPVAGEAGIIDQAVSFNGSGNLTQVADNAALNPKSVVSVEAVVFPEKNTASSSQVLITKSLSYEITLFNNRTLRVGIINEAGQRAVLDVPSVINFSQWNYIALTYDGQKIKAYVNGLLVGEKAQSGNIKWAKSKPLYVGGYGNAFFFKGKVDDVRLYEKVLSAEEIAAGYSGLPK